MLKYRRAAIEIESPEQMGYENILYNLTESSVTDARLDDLDLNLDGIVLNYGDHLGKPELRSLLTVDHANITPDDIMLTVGAAAALFIIATSLLSEGDRVVVAYPNYATNIDTPRAIGCDIDLLTLKFENRFQVDVDQLAAKITPQTKLVSLTNPHNPTGSIISEATLRHIVELVEASNAYLLIDETYREMNFGKTPPLAASLSPRVISVSSLSKTYGLPGIRLGWLISRDPVLKETFLAAKEQIYITNSVLDEEIAYRYLRNRDAYWSAIKQHIATNFSVMKDWIAGQAEIEWIEPQGGSVCFPRIKDSVDVDIDTFYDVLNSKYKTYVGPGHWFECERRYMRIGYGWPTRAELEQGLKNVTLSIREAQQSK
jgi:aspartate/methionine/tyrosine aminotransferase